MGGVLALVRTRELELAWRAAPCRALHTMFVSTEPAIEKAHKSSGLDNRDVIEGMDPIEEQLEPCRSDSARLRVYVLQGRNVCLSWCRDAASDWQSELMDGRDPDMISGESIALPAFANAKLHQAWFYDPWTDQSTEEVQATPMEIRLPAFRRSLVVRLTPRDPTDHSGL